MQKRNREITCWCLYSSRLALYAWIHTFNKNGSGLSTEREGGLPASPWQDSVSELQVPRKKGTPKRGGKHKTHKKRKW